MKWVSILLIVGLFPTLVAAAGKSRRRFKLRGPYWSAGAGAVIWQEAIRINRGASFTDMQSQLKGLVFNLDYNRTIQNSYWQQYYSLQFAYGTLKGQGDQAAIPDSFENQSWMMGVFKPGMIYRTSPVSRAGITVPLIYRKVNWVFNSGSGLTAGDKALSVGIGMLFIQRISRRSSITFAFEHQRMWATSLWSAAYTREL